MTTWSARHLDSIRLSEKQIFVLMKLFKRNYEKTSLQPEDLKRVGANVLTLRSLEKRGLAKVNKGEWTITFNGRQLAGTYDIRLTDL